ncbi:MAG: 1-(5-phosphoribosyl)-5-[(5-phosphoribosylamino)methylideneamino]imidazole-4-carboxamide isomerase [Clostridia bacterium]
MFIFPAIDLKNAQVVRLTQGDYNRVDTYDKTPSGAALEFAKSGAKFLHVVDLDGAKDGALSNFDTVKDIVNSTGMFVEIGGGIRTRERIEKYLEIGVGRVILGTAAVKNFKFLTEMISIYGNKIAVGIDANNGKVATDGWLETSNVDSVEFCKKVQSIGVQNVIYTDISKDGAMLGTNLEIYKELSKIKGLNITASGGISSIDEIEILSQIGTHSAIVGKAIYQGALKLADVIKVAGSQEV